MMPAISIYFLILPTLSNIVPDRSYSVTSYWLHLGQLSVCSIYCSGKACDQKEQS